VSGCCVVSPLLLLMSSLLLFVISLILRVIRPPSFSSSSSRPSSCSSSSRPSSSSSSSQPSSYPCSSSSSHPACSSSRPSFTPFPPCRHRFPPSLLSSPHLDSPHISRHSSSPASHPSCASRPSSSVLFRPSSCGFPPSLASSSCSFSHRYVALIVFVDLPVLALRLRVVRSLWRCGGNDAGGGCCVEFSIVRGQSEERTTGYNKCRSLFLRCTGWASHFLGPPLCCPSPIPPLSRHVPAHIPLARGGAGAAVVRSMNPGMFVIEPTSLGRGEGLVAGFLRVVGTKLRSRGGG